MHWLSVSVGLLAEKWGKVERTKLNISSCSFCFSSNLSKIEDSRSLKPLCYQIYFGNLQNPCYLFRTWRCEFFSPLWTAQLGLLINVLIITALFVSATWQLG